MNSIIVWCGTLRGTPNIHTANNALSATFVALLCDTVHGSMMFTKRAETAAVSCGASHASAVSTPLRWILKNAL